MKGKPVHLAYVVEQPTEQGAMEGKEPFWTCIGAAFAHKDRVGMTLVLRALPTSGRIVLRRYSEKPVAKEPLPEVEAS